MRREIGFVLLLVGLAIIAGSLWLLPPEIIWIGVFVAVAGVLVLCLSFIPPPVVNADAPLPLTFYAKIVGMFSMPTEVFRNLRARPYWASGFFVMVLCIVIYNVAFIQRLTPEAIAEAKINRVIESGFVPPDQAVQVKEKEIQAAHSLVRTAGTLVYLSVYLLFYLLAVTVLYLLGVAMVGGRLNLWQALSVTVYAYLPPVIIRYLLSLTILYLKPANTIDPFRGQQGILSENLGLFFSPAGHPLLYTAATFISILSLYKIWLVAKGLHTIDEQVSQRAAWGIAITVWAIGLGITLAGAFLNPSFI
jgi:hypothetical protein